MLMNTIIQPTYQQNSNPSFLYHPLNFSRVQYTLRVSSLPTHSPLIPYHSQKSSPHHLKLHIHPFIHLSIDSLTPSTEIPPYHHGKVVQTYGKVIEMHIWKWCSNKSISNGASGDSVLQFILWSDG